MKIHDFGLWFWCLNPTTNAIKWSTDIPQNKTHLSIIYDSICLGEQRPHYYFPLAIYSQPNYPYIIKLKKVYRLDNWGEFEIGRQLTLDDFEIVENPEYRANI